ncbi:MAG TPA: DUF4386 domain-containing protein [Candidatus Acidoferrales bacterium]
MKSDAGSAKKTARIAGALYLLCSVTAGFPLIYVPNHFMVEGNPAATAAKILASEMLFRVCIVSELIGAIVFAFMVRALYRLLHDIDQGHASWMVTLVLLSIPITFINVLDEIAALNLIHGGATFLATFTPTQREALAMFFLNLHANGIGLANIFWGLWLVPFGLLVLKSRFLPRFLGVWLIVDGLALVGVSVTALLLPAHLDMVNRIAIIPELGELATMLWLLIKGVDVTALINSGMPVSPS